MKIRITATVECEVDPDQYVNMMDEWGYDSVEDCIAAELEEGQVDLSDYGMNINVAVVRLPNV